MLDSVEGVWGLEVVKGCSGGRDELRWRDMVEG